MVSAGAMQTFTLHSTQAVLPKALAAKLRGNAERSSRQPARRVLASATVVDNGAATSNGTLHINDVFPPAEPEAVSPEVQALIDEQGLDLEASGLKFLTNEARVRTAADTTSYCTSIILHAT